MAPPVTEPSPALPHDEATTVAGPAPPDRARHLLTELSLLAASSALAVAAGLAYRTGSPLYTAVALAAATVVYRLWR